MLNIVCIKWGDLYGPEYVNILFDMVRRNLKTYTKGRFICFTDDAEGLDPEITVKPLPEQVTGWWNKIYLFKEGLFPKGDRILYLDQDTVISGKIDDIVKYEGDFAILRDFYRPDHCQGSCFAWTPTVFSEAIWQAWESAKRPEFKGGDQEWIEKVAELHNFKMDILQDLFPEKFVSYKAHCRNSLPRGAKIIIFHGLPRPHEVKGNWVEHLWKIGGGCAAELYAVGNTSDKKLKSNIRKSLKLGLPIISERKGGPHDGHAVIIGGAPSLADTKSEISARSDNGQDIFATNNTFKYLRTHGVLADYHVMLDARKENADFVPATANCLYASQCHPAVFKRAREKNCSVRIWHSFAENMDNLIGKEPCILVAGGSSVGIKAMILAYCMGYRQIHLYGMDSCYRDEENHAYKQPLNDKERIIDVFFKDKMYKCAPWMATQIEEFRDIAAVLVKDGCTITVHGEGLLQEVARDMGAGKRVNADLRAEAILARIQHIKNPIGAEIGVFRGELSCRLLANKDDLTLYMVDSWQKHGDFGAIEMENFYKHARTATSFAASRAKPIKKTSAEAAKDFANMSLDFAFIDADHNYMSVRQDIHTWLPKIKPGGILCGHDYGDARFGVGKAVDEFAEFHGYRLEFGEDNTWFINLKMEKLHGRHSAA